MKKLLLTIGTLATVATPIAAIVSCGSGSKEVDETYRGVLKEGQHLKFLTLGDSVAHGDYTFQMKGSGTQYMPLIDGPARAASYQDYIIDEMQRDGITAMVDRPNYKTSASGIRTDELANWLEMDSYKDAMVKSNPTTDSKAQSRIDSHLHPYTYGSDSKSVYNYGYKGKATPAKTSFDTKTYQDDKPMSDHIKESDVVMITIGGNDILKNLKILGTPYPSLGDTLSSTMLNGLIKKLSTTGLFDSMPSIKAVLGTLMKPEKIEGLTRLFSSITSSLGDVSKITTSLPQILPAITNVIKETLTAMKSINPADLVKFEHWFLSGGYKALVSVDETEQAKTMKEISYNLKRISTRITKLNPNAKIIFTGYPSPMLHLPKIVRNLAMPIYGQLGEVTQKLADENENIYYAPSSLKNWETDDPNDIYKNISADPHPTLEGQGVMARDILKVIDEIYGFKSKITDEEIDKHTSEIVAAHKSAGPTLTQDQIDKELTDGKIIQPYATDGIYHEDIDYAYGVKRLALEEIDHAKVYIPSRIIAFLIDSVTDSIKLNTNVVNPGGQSVPVKGVELTLSDFTTSWVSKYLAYVNENPTATFIEKISDDDFKNMKLEFQTYLENFINGFKIKIGKDIAQGKVLEDTLDKLKSTLSTLLTKH